MSASINISKVSLSYAILCIEIQNAITGKELMVNNIFSRPNAQQLIIQCIYVMII